MYAWLHVRHMLCTYACTNHTPVQVGTQSGIPMSSSSALETAHLCASAGEDDQSLEVSVKLALMERTQVFLTLKM